MGVAGVPGPGGSGAGAPGRGTGAGLGSGGGVGTAPGLPGLGWGGSGRGGCTAATRRIGNAFTFAVYRPSNLALYPVMRWVV